VTRVSGVSRVNKASKASKVTNFQDSSGVFSSGNPSIIEPRSPVSVTGVLQGCSGGGACVAGVLHAWKCCVAFWVSAFLCVCMCVFLCVYCRNRGCQTGIRAPKCHFPYWNPSGVFQENPKRLLQWCYKDVTVVLQVCNKGESMVG
jgi:hypothetical protein